MKLFAFILYAAGMFSAQAADLYVSKSGSDTNAGTLAKPFLTVNKAMTVAKSGDAVLLGPGVYAENVETVRSGTATGRITVDGQGAATVQRFGVGHAYVTLKRLTLSGTKSTYSAQLLMRRNGHFARIENCVIDSVLAPKVYGISWEAGATKPFSSETASDCVITGCTVKRVLATSLVSMMGDRNILENSNMVDSGQVDFLRLWGRNNIIRGNVFRNNYVVDGQGNHPDFVQTFGNNGHGSTGHIIENNLVQDMPGAQLTQLEGNLMPEIGNWTFRNNVFMNVGLQASCTIPGIKYYNNVFYRCNYVNGGYALTFGSRWYESRSVDEATAAYALIASPIASGGLVSGGSYLVKTAETATGAIVKGVEYEVMAGTGQSILYNGVSYANKATFIGADTKTFSKTGTPIVYVRGYVTYNGTKYYRGAAITANATRTYTASLPGTEVWRQMVNAAHNCEVKNNIFYDCGNGSDTKGWYSFSTTTPLTGITANYNYVARKGFLPMRPDPLKRKIGDAGGWDFQKWYEPNGINGGDPKFANLAGLNFALQSSSPLVDKGVSLSGLLFDKLGTARPQGTGIDIGPHEFASGASAALPPLAPNGLRVVLTD